MKRKILIITTHYLDRSPGQRFRFEQYLKHFEESGFEWELSNIVTPEDDKILYKPGNYFKKLAYLLRAFRKRFRDLRRKNEYDIIFIFREALPIGSTYFEKQLSKSKAKLVFDFDDAIWLMNVSDANKNLAFLKNPSKTEEIIGYCDAVIAGNEYLAAYARQYNDNVVIIPTTIDTQLYNGNVTYDSEKIVIGWIGSPTTIPHFETILPALEAIKEKYGDRVVFEIIGDASYTNTALGIEGIKWSKETEVSSLMGVDIGIMPLPDTEWAKGKCACKGLQYMALGIPTIMSPVGVNKDIIDDNVNGYLASSQEEWIEKISRLIEDVALRKSLGEKGKEIVVNQYSVEANKANYTGLLANLLGAAL